MIITEKAQSLQSENLINAITELLDLLDDVKEYDENIDEDLERIMNENNITWE